MSTRTFAPPQAVLDLTEVAIHSESRDVREEAVIKLAGIMGEMYAVLENVDAVLEVPLTIIETRKRLSPVVKTVLAKVSGEKF